MGSILGELAFNYGTLPDDYRMFLVCLQDERKLSSDVVSSIGYGECRGLPLKLPDYRGWLEQNGYGWVCTDIVRGDYPKMEVMNVIWQNSNLRLRKYWPGEKPRKFSFQRKRAPHGRCDEDNSGPFGDQTEVGGKSVGRKKIYYTLEKRVSWQAKDAGALGQASLFFLPWIYPHLANR